MLRNLRTSIFLHWANSHADNLDYNQNLWIPLWELAMSSWSKGKHLMDSTFGVQWPPLLILDVQFQEDPKIYSKIVRTI